MMANHRLTAAHKRVRRQTARQHEIAQDIARRLADARRAAAAQRAALLPPTTTKG